MLTTDREGRVRRYVPIELTAWLSVTAFLIGLFVALLVRSTQCKLAMGEAENLSRELTKVRYEQAQTEPFALAGLGLARSEYRDFADWLMAHPDSIKQVDERWSSLVRLASHK